MSPAITRYKRFIGLPYAHPHGCFKLVQQVFEQEYNIQVPHYIADIPEWDREGLTAVYFEHLVRGCTPVENPREGDLVGLRLLRAMTHIGIVVDPRQHLMLHCLHACGTVIERYDVAKYRNKIDGFFRFTPGTAQTQRKRSDHPLTPNPAKGSAPPNFCASAGRS